MDSVPKQMVTLGKSLHLSGLSSLTCKNEGDGLDDLPRPSTSNNEILYSIFRYSHRKQYLQVSVLFSFLSFFLSITSGQEREIRG